MPGAAAVAREELANGVGPSDPAPTLETGDSEDGGSDLGDADLGDADLGDAGAGGGDRRRRPGPLR